MKVKIGILGVGAFGSAFVPVFQKHPDVSEVILADINAQRLADRAKEFGIAKTFSSLEDLCRSDCDCIAIFTQRWMHANQAVYAMKAGKHVYSAVPAAVTLDEIDLLVRTVKKTGMFYMLGETSYYRPQTVYCRKKYAEGAFGDFVYGEGQYYHDMSHFYTAYLRNGGTEWKKQASFPPMLYATHSTAFILGVTFRRMTEVSCLGYTDKHEDGVFNKKLSLWRNVFSNETALFRTSDGGMARVNEFRRAGAGLDHRITVSPLSGKEITGDGRMNIIGTLASYHEQEGSSMFTRLDISENYKINGEIQYDKGHELVGIPTEDVSYIRDFSGVVLDEKNIGSFPRNYIGKVFRGISPMQPYHNLPIEFADVKNGHAGTHAFLVNDFLRSVTGAKLPPTNVWLAARFNAPGLVAHESAQKGGVLMKIPDFGMPPVGSSFLEPEAALLP